MAATVTGAFVIIDRATGPMKRMERQAIKTMAAIEGVGLATDKASGTRSGAQKLEQHARALQNVERAARGARGETDRHGAASRRATRDHDTLARSLTKLGGIFIGIKALMGGLKFAALGVGVAFLAQAIGGLVGGLTALLPALARTANAVAALPALLGAAAQAAGALLLSFSGVGKAITTGWQAQTQAGENAKQMADQQRAAADALRGAERGVTMAARGSRNANEALAMSNRTLTDSQKRLTDARRDARRELQDMVLAQQSAALGARGADLGLRRAQEALAQRAIDPTATALDMEEAQLAVAEARLNRRQSRLQRTRTREDLTTVRRRGGVGQMPQVVDALRGVEDAQRGVRDASEGVADAMYQQGEAARQLAEAQRQAKDAMSGGTTASKQYGEAMKQLGPQQQRFVKQVISMRPTLMRMRREIGTELFANLTPALQRATRLFPTLTRNMRASGGIIGRGVRGLVGDLTTPQRLGDVNAVMAHQNRLLADGVASLRALIVGFLDLALAARPFTEWISSTVRHWTEMWAVHRQVNREFGVTQGRLARTRDTLQRFGSILRNVWSGLTGMFRAATPAGEGLWRSIDRGTRRWAIFANSIVGQRRMRDWFNRTADMLREMGWLIRDLGVAWGRLTVSPGFMGAVQALRRSVPFIERLLEQLALLGPSAGEFLGQIVRMLTLMPFSPVRVLVDSLTLLLKTINLLLEKIPGLGLALSAALTIGLVGKVAGAFAKIGLLRTAWNGVTAAILRTSAAQTALLRMEGAGVAGAAGAGFFGRLRARGARTPAPGAPGVNPAQMVLPGLEAAAVGGGAARAGWLARLRGGLRGGLGGWGAPLAIAGGIGATLLGNAIGGRAGGALSGAAAGAGYGALAGSIIPVLGTGLGAGLGAVAGGVIGWIKGGGAKKASAELKEFGKTADSTYKSLVAAGDEAGLRRLAREARSFTDEAGKDADKLRTFAFDVDATAKKIHDAKIGAALLEQFRNVTGPQDSLVRRLVGRMRGISPEARTATAKAMYQMAITMEKQGALPVGAARALVKLIKGELDELPGGAKDVARRTLNLMRREFIFEMQLWQQEHPGKDFFKDWAPMTEFPLGTQVVKYKGPQELAKWQARMAAQGFKLTVDGVLGPQTMKVAEQVGVALKKVASNQKSTFSDAAGSVRRTQRGMQGTVLNVGKTLSTHVNTIWPKIRSTIRNNARGAQREASGSFGKLLTDATNALVATGLTRGQAAQILRGSSGAAGYSKGSGRPDAKGGRVRYGGGGRIPGMGLLDTIPVAPGHIAAPGELIVNRHTEDRVRQRYGVDLGAEVAHETRPHSAARKTYARGGYVGGATAPSGAAARALANALFARGFSVTSGGEYRGTGTYHDRGMALDFGSSVNDLPKLWSILFPRRRQLLELLGPWGLYDNGTKFFDAGLQAQHMDHIHVAIAEMLRGALRAGAFGLIQLARPLTRFRGAPGALAQQAMDAYRGRLLKLANEGDLDAGVKGANQKIGHALMRRFWPEGQWPSLKELWMRESGWRTTADNPTSDAYGIPQALPGSKMASEGPDWKTNPRTQIMWGLKYIQSVYGSPSAALAAWNARSPHWYGGGGRVPWYGDGGDFTVRRPTLIGVGDKQAERVTVTPERGGRPAGRGARALRGPVTVSIGHITYAAEGDIEEAIRKEFERLTDDIEIVGVDE